MIDFKKTLLKKVNMTLAGSRFSVIFTFFKSVFMIDFKKTLLKKVNITLNLEPASVVS